MKKIFSLTLSAVALALLATACGSMQANAQKDPMKCERDPKCTQKSRANDCSTQCSDDPACVDRCREIETQTGGIGR